MAPIGWREAERDKDLWNRPLPGLYLVVAARFYHQAGPFRGFVIKLIGIKRMPPCASLRFHPDRFGHIGHERGSAGLIGLSKSNRISRALENTPSGSQSVEWCPVGR